MSPTAVLPARSRRRLGLVLLVVLALLTGGGLAYTVQKMYLGRAGRHVHLSGRDVSGMSEAQLWGVVAEERQRLATTPVVLKFDGSDHQTDAASAGVGIDEQATVRRVLEARTGIGGWFQSFWRTVDLAPAWTVDEARTAGLTDGVLRSDPDSAPTDATVVLADDGAKLVGKAGSPGRAVDNAKLAGELKAKAEAGLNPQRATEIPVAFVPRTPRFTKADADTLAARAEKAIAQPLTLKGGETTGEVSTSSMRKMITSAPGPAVLELKVNQELAADAARSALEKANSGATESTFTVDAAGKPVLVPGKTGTKCCAPGYEKTVAAAVLDHNTAPVEVPLVLTKPKFGPEDAEKLKITQQISTFTTRHAAGQPRVTNIHRIADLVRGQVILPGETFSLNGAVGERTTAKGFVADHAIFNGVYRDEVGGGISQFATTTFNAAWLAGLKVPEYQAHSIYISRYPKGREATISWPSPDLKIANSTPYGILVWTSYTDTSITVSLYSTPFYKQVSLNPTPNEKPYKATCSEVTTDRVVVLPDGSQRKDQSRAIYQKEEGLLCDGTKVTPSTTPGAPPTSKGPSTPTPSTPAPATPATTATTKKKTP